MKFQEQVERLTEDDSTVNEGVPSQQTPSEESREREIVNGEKGELKVRSNNFVSVFNDLPNLIPVNLTWVRFGLLDLLRENLNCLKFFW